LLGLQINFLMVNLLAMAAALRTPMILARTGNNETILGTVASITAIGGVAGSLVMSIWGGPKRKILGVLGGLILVNVGRAGMGLGHDVVAWSISGFFAVFFIAVCNSSNQAIWQAKTPPDVQGRVFAARRFTGQITIPLGALIAGPLSDRLFEPAMAANGHLAPIFGGVVGGTGPGAGMSLLILLAAIIGMIVPAISYVIPAFRNVEDIMPDSDVVSSYPSSSREIIPDESKGSVPRPSTK
jgi:MFS transporter, DHA3 family, macrolide efflux protein